MDYLVWIWLAVVVSTAVLEFVTQQMVSIWFTFAGIVAIILAFCGVPWWIQVIVFIALALVLLLALRKICLKYFLKNTNTHTNADSLIGTVHKLLAPISEDTPGIVKISGVKWTAVSEDNEAIDVNTEVEIVSIEGNKLIVNKKEEQKGE